MDRQENIRDDPDYQPEIVFDPTNPEDLCIAKETWSSPKATPTEFSLTT